jgi:DNA segregation ATPase FtsK/SpoIIIE-like protein
MLPTLGKYSQWSSDESGVSLTIYRHGLEGLPEFVSTHDIWKKCPANQPPYTLAVGFGDNSSTHFIDPTSYPHLLVSGTTGWGKSMLINNFISFLLNRGRTPKELQFVLFDLKKGMEFSFYKDIPHLFKDEGEDPIIKTGIIEDLEGVLPALRRLQEIRDKRMETIKKAGYKNWADYNLGEPVNKMSAIFLVFDEWAKIRLSRSAVGTRALVVSVGKLADETVKRILYNGEGEDRRKLTDELTEFGKGVLKLRSSKHFGLEAEELLAEFTNLSRAAGMFVILATQHPSKEVLTGLIMINFPTRIVLKSSIGGSMAALGTQSAYPLEYKGRAILLDRGTETKIQTPFISDETIHSIVHKAITGEDTTIPTGVSIETILTYALDKFSGDLSHTKLYSHFREQGVKFDWLKNGLRSLDGKEVVLKGVKYKVITPSGARPRRLALV